MTDQETLILIATLVTAASGVALAFLTASLIAVSRKSNEINSAADLNVRIEHNQWSIVLFDVVVFNAGRAAAYNINLCFSPDFTIDTRLNSYQSPPFNFSVLNSNSEIRMTFNNLALIKDTTINFELSWAHDPIGKFKKILKISYPLDQLMQQQYVEKLRPDVKIANDISVIAKHFKK